MDLVELLNHIDPAACDYSEWTNVGMALKEEGYPVNVWDDWSRQDVKRYHRGECAKKWNSFNGAGEPVTGGTIYQMAIDRGWKPDYGRELAWDDVISQDDKLIDKDWVEETEIKEPEVWDPAGEIIRYLETLFEAGENVGYLMQSYENDKGKYIPQNKGNWDRTAGQLIEELSKCNGDIGTVLGDYNPNGGAWIRFNPLDGKGVKNDNVADFRYALVESDDMDLEKQNGIIRALELPVAALVYSGKKSLHAIVRVEAGDFKEYKERVNYLYDVCKKNGMIIDTQNRNPSRLSRLPGVTRGDKKQFIVDTNIGKSSWKEWKEWIESINDDLPDIEELDSAWNDLPPLADELIEGVLRKGHKMLIAGPSKAGKSFLQIELTIAIAEGKKWLGWKCSKGRVMYVNLELDRASCLHRFRDVYEALKIVPDNLKNIDIWNLRGKAVPMDKLAPKLIRRAQKKQYEAIIIDPIYKVITGDENSADQMAKFCNQFDLICAELGCAVIYCHHHSKGTQGQKKALDRASGSGVFARDPDAHLDIIQLESTEDLIKQEVNKAVCAVVMDELKNKVITAWDWKNDISQDDELNSITLLNICENHLSKFDFGRIKDAALEAEKHIKERTAWRIEGVLREFKTFDPVNAWFDYPVHILDDVGSLKDVQPEEEKAPWERGKERRTKQAEQKKIQQKNEFEVAFCGLEENGEALMQDIAEQIGVDSKTIGAWFGTGKKSRKDYKEKYEKYQKEEDGKMYIRRKSRGATD